MIPLLAFGMPGAPEWIVISLLALVLFGPKKLPELARGVGKALGELQKAKEDFHREITGVPPMPKIELPVGIEGRQGVPSSISSPELTSAPPVPHSTEVPAASVEEKKV